AFREVMREFAGYYETLEVENTDNVLPRVVQRDTAYRFIQEELCAKANMEFLVRGGTVSFRSPRTKKEAVAALSWGEGLMSFQERRSQCNQTIRVFGRAQNKKDQLTVEIAVKTPASSGEIAVVKEYQNYSLVGEDAVRRYAEGLAGRHRAAGSGGSGVCIGLPELMPGSGIRLGNLDSDTPKEYYIRSVKHSMGSDGYTTQFEVEGYK
ncbi:MAG: hypothetical protein K2N94_08415, partial [Lachnospiraceae bacterium]|nr:hypothetical protein [Lachnospiraceae bacterium]